MQHLPRFRRFFLVAALLAVAAVAAQAQTPSADSTAAAAVVREFHALLEAGDGPGAARLLAADAVILESGSRETRKEYLEHHLGSDLQFAQTVPSRRSDVRVTVAGDVAWISSVSVTQGTFEKRPINLKGAELVVLSKSAAGWTIRAIHWSSRKSN